MAEVIPRISYSQEGLLVVRSLQGNVESATADAIASNREGYGVAVSDSALSVSVEMPALFRNGPDGGLSEPDAIDLIDTVALVAGFEMASSDGVLSVESIAHDKLSLFVHPHFQRWLNAAALSEEVAKTCVRAMASVGGAGWPGWVMENQRYGSDVDGYDFADFSVSSVQSGFLIRESVLAGEEIEFRSGRAQWRSLRLATFGEYVLDVDESEREVHAGREKVHPGLYRLQSHNLGPIEAVSFLLGAASLADTARQYAGREDIFSGVEWSNYE